MAEWNLPGKRKKVRLNKHTITIIEATPKEKLIPINEGQEKLRKILLDAQ